MNRALLIIVGIILTLVLIAVWVYMLFFSNPTGEDRNFANLNLGNTDSGEVAPMVEESFEEEEVLVDVVDDSPLKQLTTEPVIGFREVMKDASSTPEIYYVKPGTGHIMSIDLETGEEKRISGTTIPGSRRASISNNGVFALVQVGLGHNSVLKLGLFSTSSEEMTLTNLSESVSDFTITSDNQILYIESSGGQSIIKHYKPESLSTSILATIPFMETTVDWGEAVTSAHYVYPKANSKLEGYLYAVNNGNFTRLPIEGYGLTATGNDDYVLYGQHQKGYYLTYLYNLISSSKTLVRSAILPEKCAWNNVKQYFICADSLAELRSNTPDVWYEGSTSYNDDLWMVSPQSTSTTKLLDIKEESGREIDVIKPLIVIGSEKYLFQNKNDQTLWLYKTQQ